MIAFIAVLFSLFCVSFLSKDKTGFTKEKMLPLKAILAILIVADHITFQVDLNWIQPFRKWGAPIVSVFFFISGYGLQKSYIRKGAAYLSGFFSNRLLRVIIPSIIALGLYYIIVWNPERDYISSIVDLFKYGYPLLPHSWYVEIIVILYATFWASYKFLPEKMKIHSLIIWSILIIMATYFGGYDRCWYICTLAFPTGAYYAKYEHNINGLITNPLYYIAAFLVCILGLGLFYITGREWGYLFCYIFIPLSIALVISYLPIDKVTSKAITFIGGISYEIYLCQGIGMELFHKDPLIIKSDGLYILSVYFITILLAWIVNRLSAVTINAITRKEK